MSNELKSIRVLAFTSCGHCPLAIVELKGKCKPMEVYCPLQKEDGHPKLVYETSYIGSLHDDCPLPTVEQFRSAYSKRLSLADAVEFVELCNRVRGVYRYGQGTNTKKELDDAMPNRRR